MDDDRKDASRRRTLDVLGSTLDPDNPISALRGNALVLSDIFRRVKRWERCRDAVRLTEDDAYQIISARRLYHWYTDLPRPNQDSPLLVFPPPRDLCVNMMPFKLFQPRETLSAELHPYLPLIARCPTHPVSTNDFDTKVAYLTVHESAVEAGASQRRPGLHVERPGHVADGRGRVVRVPKGAECWDSFPDSSEYRNLCWGLGGHNPDGWPVNGIYMASSVSDTCAVWAALVDADRADGIVDALGGMEELREHLGQPRLLKAGELCWITDLTPHEALRVEHAHYRQFFRLVVGPISVWYSKHNTANPLGVQPTAPVSDADKFDAMHD